MQSTRDFLRTIGLPPGDLGELPTSDKRFPAGAQYGVEIPSVEGPRCPEAAFEDADRLGAPVRRLAQLGASTINLPTDLSLAQIAAIRAAVGVPLDLYVEAPDSLGGFVRLHEIPELIRVSAPVYVKFGLRNAPEVYPAGTHLDE